MIRHYPQLQGWRLIPLSAVFVASSLWRAGVGRWLPEAISAPGVLTIAIAMAVAASFPIRRLYGRAFGGARARSTWRDAGGLLTLAVVFVAMAAAGERIRGVSIPSMFVGCALLSSVLASNGLRWYYTPVAAAWFLFAVSGRLGVQHATRDVLFDGLIGLSLMVCGLGDHVLLTRTLVLRRKDEHGRPS